MGLEHGYKIRNKAGIHFLTFAVVEWVDVFTRLPLKNIFIESLSYCQKHKSLKIHAWCLMSNHVHIVVSSEIDDVGPALRDFKKYTSKMILQRIKIDAKISGRRWMLPIFSNAGRKNSQNQVYQFWRQDNHPVELFSNSFTRQKIEYIHNNPVVAGIVDSPEDYIYSSARNYVGKPGLIAVDVIEY